MKNLKETMKAAILTVMTCLLVFVTVKPSLAISMRGRTIILYPIPDAPGAPRTPVFNPFFAELIDGFTSVLLRANDNVGTVCILITSTAGDNYSTYFDSSDGTILLPISGNTGHYTMTITVSGGTQFVGEFTL